MLDGADEQQRPRALEFYSLGGAVVEPAQNAPYGPIAVVTGPMGAPFRTS
ncbi:MAG: hypothetical protein QOJ06_33 [Pseudonocardiales bacterium]|jgi:hypothetical protein|nr:hypothetical protein [Pseudonocardiales bacterium]